jgi:hypothetical protein
MYYEQGKEAAQETTEKAIIFFQSNQEPNPVTLQPLFPKPQ